MSGKPQSAIFVAVFLVSLLIFGLSLLVNGEPKAVKAEAPRVNATEKVTIEEPTQTANCLEDTRFPESIRQWCGSIEVAAGQTGLAPELIAAVMLQESGGDPQAISPSGAVGLLQVMPRDGIAAGFVCPNGPCFASRPSTDELLEPSFNINYGARLLAGLLNRTNDLREALHGYGPMDVGYAYADAVLAIYTNYR